MKKFIFAIVVAICYANCFCQENNFWEFNYSLDVDKASKGIIKWDGKDKEMEYIINEFSYNSIVLNSGNRYYKSISINIKNNNDFKICLPMIFDMPYLVRVCCYPYGEDNVYYQLNNTRTGERKLLGKPDDIDEFDILKGKLTIEIKNRNYKSIIIEKSMLSTDDLQTIKTNYNLIELFKRGYQIYLSYYNKFDNKIYVREISLSGFTKKYNELLNIK